MPKSRYFFGRHWRVAAFESDPRTKMAKTTSLNDDATVSSTSHDPFTGVRLFPSSMLLGGTEMPLGSSGYDPFWMIRWPFSGNVNERITAPWFSPSLTVNYAGDARIEDRVVTEVASYGRQLGWLTEIALALANKQDPPPDTVRRLKQAAEAIEAIKREVQPSAIDAARTALDRLERDQPAQYERLLSERQRKRRT